MHIHWSAFQSIAQLSVALNATFATIVTFLGGDLDQEERRIRNAIFRLRQQTPAPLDAPIRIAQLMSLSGSLVRLQRGFKEAVDVFVRPLCIAGVIVGAAVLVYGSFYADSDITGFGLLLTFVSAAPFLIGFLSSIMISAWVKLVCARRRSALE